MRPVSPSPGRFGLSSGSSARLALLISLCFASLSARAQTAPFWIQSDVHAESHYPTYVPSGRELVGRSMVLAPITRPTRYITATPSTSR